MPIELQSVSFSYPQGELAVESVSLTINEGERVAIIGQNGAGKTTTVKLMNGLLKPTSGDVLVDGLSTLPRSTAAVARDVGYIFQNPDDQIFSSTVRKELEYMPRYLGWSQAEMDQRVARAGDLCGISEHLDTNPNDLPFAIKKFVAIASILVGRCKYLIFDEPTAGLDPRGVYLLDRMMDILAKENVAVITITHDMRFVAESFERIIVMAHRQVIADATATEVFAADSVLEAARLRRPDAAQLARDVSLGSYAVRLHDIAALIP